MISFGVSAESACTISSTSGAILPASLRAGTTTEIRRVAALKGVPSAIKENPLLPLGMFRHPSLAHSLPARAREGKNRSGKRVRQNDPYQWIVPLPREGG